MAVVISSNGNSKSFDAKMTVYVFICVIIAAVGGLIFGYDIGISGSILFSNVILYLFRITYGLRNRI